MLEKNGTAAPNCTVLTINLARRWIQFSGEIPNIIRALPKEGTPPADFFAAAIIQFLHEIFSEIITTRPTMAAVPNSNAYGPCPKCKTGTVRKKIKGAGRSR